jgi:hypothetical protein
MRIGRTGRILFTIIPVTCWARRLIFTFGGAPTFDLNHDPHSRRNTKALSFVAPICSRRGIERPVKIWHQSARHDPLEPSRTLFLLIHDHMDFAGSAVVSSSQSTRHSRAPCSFSPVFVSCVGRTHSCVVSSCRRRVSSRESPRCPI